MKIITEKIDKLYTIAYRLSSVFLCEVYRIPSGSPVPQNTAHQLARRIITPTTSGAGRGSCRFHPPDRHPPFGVNRDMGYWVCFHEVNPETGRYLGGDAIEFYRRLNGLGFKDAVNELAEMNLQCPSKKRQVASYCFYCPPEFWR